VNQEPLGKLLVRRGLITDEQLAAALADQRATGEPLGKIVVARGYVASSTVAQALATQHGGLLKTEYGFATGFDSGEPAASFVEPPLTPQRVSQPPVTSVPVAGRVVVAAEAAPRVFDDQADREAVRAEISMAAAETEKLRVENARLVDLRATLEQRLSSESQRSASLERELAAARDEPPPTSGLEAQVIEAASRIAELEAALEARDAVIKTWQAGVRERDAAIEGFKAMGDRWVAALAERDAAIAELSSAREALDADPWAAAERHLLFFQGPDGWELVERNGPPPAPGALLGLESGMQLVARVGGSPAPGQRIPCAYLLAV
jgi:hypothetical protein